MPPWLIAYVVAAVGATVALAWRSFGFPDERPLILSFLLWIVAIAGAGLVVWSLIACVRLHWTTPSFIRLCFVGSAYWASAIVALYLPGYAAILAALVRLHGRDFTPVQWLMVAAALSLPAGLALFLGYAWPDYPGDQWEAQAGVVPGIMACGSMYSALVLTRSLMPKTHRAAARAV